MILETDNHKMFFEGLDIQLIVSKANLLDSYLLLPEVKY